jgi:hypothetical protein
MSSGANVPQELRMVARLQEIDRQLWELEMEKGDLPGQVQKLDSDIAALEAQKETHEARLAEIGKEVRELDGKHQLLKVKLDKYKDQLYQVTTNREYDAINNEIESTRAEMEQIEVARQVLKKEEEEINGNVEALQERIEELEKERKERKSELGSKTAETDEEEAELLHEREKLFVRIKKPIIAHYERIRNSRTDSAGAAHLYNGACGACFAVVPPQRQAEIRKQEDVILCESCGVILLPEPEHLEA